MPIGSTHRPWSNVCVSNYNPAAAVKNKCPPGQIYLNNKCQGPPRRLPSQKPITSLGAAGNQPKGLMPIAGGGQRPLPGGQRPLPGGQPGVQRPPSPQPQPEQPVIRPIKYEPTRQDNLINAANLIGTPTVAIDDVDVDVDNVGARRR